MKSSRVEDDGSRYAKGILSAGVFTPEQLRYLNEELEKIVAAIDNHGEVLENMSFTKNQLDSTTNAVKTIDYPHNEVHSGSHYYIEGYTTLDSGVSMYVKLVTPDSTKWSHFQWEISSSFILTTTLTEDATGGMTGGVSVTPRNSNRNYPDASGMAIKSGVTVNTGGTIIASASWGAKSDGGGHSRENEIILKQNTTYCRAFTSSTNSNIVAFRASWYEHSNK